VILYVFSIFSLYSLAMSWRRFRLNCDFDVLNRLLILLILNLFCNRSIRDTPVVFFEFISDNVLAVSASL